ncbi:MAG: radical SAM protein [Nitrospirae bacterium]|nr:radical SAM protein [Nitrospirota bacterium]
MRLYLLDYFALKNLEAPSVYNIKADELYELDAEAFSFLKKCSGPEGASPADADSEFIDYCVHEGIITDKTPYKHFAAETNKPSFPSLRYLELQITDRCNLRCKHCYIGEPSGRELAPETILDAISQFEQMQGLRLLVTGGEPLLHRCFDSINDLLHSFRLRKVLLTNGLMLTKERISGINFDEIQFSIDGMRRGHEVLRGAGSYDKVMNSLENVLASGISASVATMVHSCNLDEFDEMDNLFSSMGIKDWIVDVPCISGSLGANNELSVSPEKGGRYFSYGFSEGMHGSSEGYGCGLHLASVLADGSVAKCAFYADRPAGNITEGLAICWKRIEPIMLSNLECSDVSCPWINECRGGCRYRAGISNGENFLAQSNGISRLRDVYKCRAYGYNDDRAGGMNLPKTL